jgi:hypothetical protein
MNSWRLHAAALGCIVLLIGCATKSSNGYLTDLQKRAESGDPAAQRILGEAFETGRYGSRDPIEAVKWYQRAADQGDAMARFNLGNLYQHGRGVATNLDRAIELYTQAAEQGLIEAQHRMGYLHDVGLGTASDMAAATSWYRMAAEQGCVDAMMQVGVSYSLGAGAPRDLLMAWMCLSLAHDFAVHDGDSKMRTKTAGLLDDLEQQMTPTQIADARLKAEQWRQEFSQRNQFSSSAPAGLQSLKHRAN